MPFDCIVFLSSKSCNSDLAESSESDLGDQPEDFDEDEDSWSEEDAMEIERVGSADDDDEADEREGSYSPEAHWDLKPQWIVPNGLTAECSSLPYQRNHNIGDCAVRSG
ncbi:hypothetical protein R3P38DRAFT_2778502 [Favolaschia claudopus]|uniref:Uncharacterized protein n=1 Tax=Favolaschia claudopus TaxID=2862362 RepID=A0AAW0BHZ1_9AGAR